MNIGRNLDAPARRRLDRLECEITRPWTPLAVRWVDVMPQVTPEMVRAYAQAKRWVRCTPESWARTSIAQMTQSGRLAWRASLARRRWEAGRAQREAETEARREAETEARRAARRSSWTPKQWAARERYLRSKEAKSE